MTALEYRNMIMDNVLAILGASASGIDVFDNFEELTDAEDVDDLISMIEVLSDLLIGVFSSHYEEDEVDSAFQQFLELCTSRREDLYYEDSDDSGNV